jgi:2-oxoglutarate ferredoxin oxidoreductase subunit beta
MDNQVYGLTKGQSSPTTELGEVTSSTPFGKPEEALIALKLYLSMGASYVASTLSTKVRQMGLMINDAMNHPGFAVVHVQSPCTTYNDTFEILKGNPKKGIAPLAWDIPDEHDPADQAAAYEIAASEGVPIGVLYRDESRMSFDQRVASMAQKAKPKGVEELLKSHAI